MLGYNVYNSIIISVCLLQFTTFAAQLPKTWQRCKKSTINDGECLRSAVENAVKQLKNGSPELGVPAFEPLLISALDIGEGTGPVNVAQHFKDIKLHGLTGSKVISSEINLEDSTLFARSITPELRLEASYSMDGRILLLHIEGSGPCNVTLINTKINHTLVGEKYQKKGKEFMRFKEYNVTLRPEKVEFKFDNLFNGNDQLGENINKVLNENWDSVFGDVRSGYEESFGIIFKDLANRVFNKVVFNDIFQID